jgi:hypothetical protein
MKYNLNINQYAVFNNPEFSCLTLQDLVVFDFVKDFANSSACKRNSDGYFWIKHTIVSDALPILGVFNEESQSRKDICRAKIAQIMRKLCKVGLLSASPDNEAKGISEYGFGANYDKMIFAKDAQKNSDPSKNLLPPYQNSTTSPSKNLLPYNSNNTNININDDKGSGNVPLPAPEATYNDFLAANNFSRLSLTAFTLTDAQAQAAKIKHGEAGYLSTLAKLDDYLEKNPTYMQSKKDFNAVFRNFADNDDLSAAKIAWNAFFTAKHGESYTKYSKADESALETILKHIKEKLKDGDSIGSKIAGFFNALSQLPKYNEPMNCKLTFIANDYTNIVAHLGKQREAQKQVVPTLSPADAKEQAIKTLAEIGLTDEMIGFIQSAKCTDLQTAKNLTISQLFKAGKFDAANGEKFNQCLKVLRPMLR